MSILIIAEAGVNHNGSLAMAKQLAGVAKAAGADIVKFQTAKPELVISRFAEKAEYQKAETGEAESQLEMCKRIHLTFDEHAQLKEYCDSIGIAYLSTPFDLDSIDFLQQLGTPMWKVPSGEITNLPYLEKIAATKKPVILSTGMSMISEIEDALTILEDGGAGPITLLHCNTEYPTPIEDANLLAMQDLREQFGLPVGYSDHTAGIEADIAAAALGRVYKPWRAALPFGHEICGGRGGKFLFRCGRDAHLPRAGRKHWRAAERAHHLRQCVVLRGG